MEQAKAGRLGGPGGVALPPVARAPRKGLFARIWGELKREEARTGWLFLAPAMVYFAIFTGFPLVYGFWVSLQEWNLMSPRMTFVGADNYLALLDDNTFHECLLNTTIFTVGIVACVIVFSFLVSVLLNQKVRRMTLFRGIFYSPAVTSVVAISVVWLWVLDPEYGLINQLLRAIDIVGPRWLADSNWALPGLVMTAAWRNVGYFAVVFLAGLQGIDQMYYEAASIDGANWWSRFRHITVPMLAPTTFFVLVMTIIMSFQVFALVYVMTGGGPGGTTAVIVFYLYKQAFVYFRMGYASAVGYVLFAIIFILTLIQFRFLGKAAEV